MNSVSPDRPLCVDCDGTMIACDLLHESLVKAILRNPLLIFQVLLWLIQGRCVLKSNIAEIIQIDPNILPYRNDVISFLQSRKKMGISLILVTATSESYARQVAAHFGIFDDIFSSNERINLKGENKKNLLIELFGYKGFDYIGDADADLPVWASANSAIVVGRNAQFLSKVKKVNSNACSLSYNHFNFIKWFKIIRIHQWAKNIIIFLPLLTSHQILNIAHLLDSLAAFVSLSLVASATYVMNDLFDLDHDRAHKTKKLRPLASGAVGIPGSVGLALVLLVAGVSIAAFLPAVFWLCLALYVAVTLSYSFCLKKIAIIDAIVLAGLYTLRLLIGHAATGVPVSVWLLAFSIFLFFSLALVKRFVEIGDLKELSSNSGAIQGRGYCANDYWLVGALGVSCAVLSVLVLILYVNSPEVRILYSSPILLMLLAPIFLYWIGRVWLLAARGRMNEDPVLFALRDKASYAIGLATLVVIFLAAGGK